MIDAQVLRALIPWSKLSRSVRAEREAMCVQLAPVFNRALLANGITGPAQMAMIVAQFSHESGYFPPFPIEGRARAGTRAAAQQARYEPPSSLARDLGNTVRGDGWRYRGRGYIQLTGKGNYRAFTDYVNANPVRFGISSPVDFVANPDLICQQPWSVEAGMWYLFVKHNDLSRYFLSALSVLGFSWVINGPANALTMYRQFQRGNTRYVTSEKPWGWPERISATRTAVPECARAWLASFRIAIGYVPDALIPAGPSSPIIRGAGGTW